MNTTVAISDLRKKFGDIEAMLPYVEIITLTKKGKSFAILTASDKLKRSVIKKTAGSFKNTEFGEVRAELKIKGQIIEDIDIFIASICLIYNLILITADRKHFSKIRKLKIY